MVCVFQGFTSFGFGSNSRRVKNTSWQRAPFLLKLIIYFIFASWLQFPSLLSCQLPPAYTHLSVHSGPLEPSEPAHTMNCSVHYSGIEASCGLDSPSISWSTGHDICTFPRTAKWYWRSVCAPLSKGLWTLTEVLFVLVNKSDQIWLFWFVLFCSLCVCFEHIYCGNFHYSYMTIYFNFIEWRQAFLF